MEEKYIQIKAEDSEAQGRAVLTPFLSSKIGPPKPAMIVCPGGGYTVLSEKEGTPVALRFQSYGMQAFLLEYSVGVESPYPKAMRELACAVSHIRKNAQQYHVDPDRIFLCGLSAGGHLAASLAVHGKAEWVRAYDFPTDFQPKGIVLCYPVTGDHKEGEMRSYQILRAGLRNQELEQYLYVDQYISKDMVPTFLWHNMDDTIVSASSSLDFLRRLQTTGISCEAHFFPEGGHMLSLCDESTAEDQSQINKTCAQWVPLALDWMKRLCKS